MVKPPHSGAGAAFGWHRDGAWCHAQAAPQPRYISVWVPLDDVSEENGACRKTAHPLLHPHVLC